MRIGLLVTSMGDFGQSGYYNQQEVGLAKALDALFDEIVVYKLVSREQEKGIEHIRDCKNAKIQYCPALGLGTNGIINTKVLDNDLDVLIYFSDTQLLVPKVYRWAQRHNIKFFPYIGVIESHSMSRIKKVFMNTMFRKNIKIYKRCSCFAKSPSVKEKLYQLGVKQVIVAPVGLELSLLRENYEEYNMVNLKRKYGYQKNDKLLLFIGRLVAEKQPIKMIEIFAKLTVKDSNYKLLMIGVGELKYAVLNSIQSLGLENKVQIIDRIPNCDIWELYRCADVFINLNQQEIWGMAILEAMFYGCKVVAWKAPGPNYIIEDRKNGFLVDTDEELMDCVLNGEIERKAAHSRIVNCLTWEASSKVIVREITAIG